MTAMLRSVAAVGERPVLYPTGGAFIAVNTLLSIIPLFLSLFLTVPISGRTSSHLDQRLSSPI